MDVREFYVLVHDECGPVEIFSTHRDAIRALHEVLRDEPDWGADLRVERFSVVGGEAAEPK